MDRVGVHTARAAATMPIGVDAGPQFRFLRLQNEDGRPLPQKNGLDTVRVVEIRIVNYAQCVIT